MSQALSILQSVKYKSHFCDNSIIKHIGNESVEKQWLINICKDFKQFQLLPFLLISLTGCASGYNTDAYSQFKTLNTQAAEQRNSSIKKLKSSLSYMHEHNFFAHLKCFIASRNAIKIAHLRTPLNQDEINLKKYRSQFRNPNCCRLSDSFYFIHYVQLHVDVFELSL